MRLRKKWWARPEMEKDSRFITNPKDYCGKWAEEFKNSNEIQLELGSGRGRFITEKALNNPNINFIGIDLKDEVLVYIIRRIVELGLENVRIIPLYIEQIEGIFAPGEIGKIYINFCNPWPKDRHNKRRLTHNRFLSEYKKFIAPGSEIWFKTDNEDLFEASEEYFKESGFEIKYLTYDLHNSDFEENIITEYEAKFTSLGMKTMFLIGRLL